jgi:hypothetical protein
MSISKIDSLQSQSVSRIDNIAIQSVSKIKQSQSVFRIDNTVWYVHLESRCPSKVVSRIDNIARYETAYRIYTAKRNSLIRMYIIIYWDGNKMKFTVFLNIARRTETSVYKQIT